MKKIISLFVIFVISFVFLAQASADLNDGLIAYYPFNGNANDESGNGNGNDGTVYGATLTMDRFGNVDSAYSFDGVDDYIRIPDSTSLDITGDLTISAWINTSENFHIIFSNMLEVSPHDGYSLRISDGKVRFMSGGGNLYSDTLINTSTWKHIAVTLSGTTAIIYVDGEFDSSGTVGVPTDNNVDQTIGASYSPWYFLKGFIDDVAIYNRALSEYEVQAIYSLVAYYPFNGNANDESGNGNDGTVYGATLTMDRFGNVDSAYSFDGVDDYIRIPDSTSLDITGDLTISAWINTSENFHIIFSNMLEVSPHDGYSLRISDGKVRFMSGGGNLYSDTLINTGTWRHIAVTLSGTTAIIYVDGEFDSSGTVGVPTANTVDQTIGASYSPWYFLKGFIDDVAIYNRALSEYEVQALYTMHERYSEKETFLISDEAWRDVLSLVPLTTWTDNGTIYKYPTLIYHKEEDSFDADSIIYFLQQYSPTHLTIVDETPQELDNLLIADRPFGAGLAQFQINKITMNDYFSYWPQREVFVVAEDDYETGLMASVFASYVHAPLLFEDHFDYGVIRFKKVYIIGNLRDQQAIEDIADVLQTYSLTDLQQRYVELTSTDKIILVNPEDLGIAVPESYSPDKSTKDINRLYTNHSLAAPILASAKHELIICNESNDYQIIDQFVEDEISSLNLGHPYLTIIASPSAVPMSRGATPSDGCGWANRVEVDSRYYASLGINNEYVDLPVGRIFGISTSDVSSYIARDLFFDEIVENNDALVFVNEVLGYSGYATYEDFYTPEIRNQFDNTTVYLPENVTDYSYNEYDDNYLILFYDHGYTGGFCGMMSSNYLIDNQVYLDLPVIMDVACSTCKYHTTVDQAIGANHGPNYFLEGLIDDVAICNRALSESEIQELYSEGGYDLVAYYPFNGNANDESGKGNDGTVYGATPTTDRFGNPNSAYSFDGVDDYVRIPDSTSLDITGDLTISAWVNTSDSTGIAKIFSNYTAVSPHAGYDLSMQPDGKVRFMSDGGDLYGNIPINTDTWKHVAVTRSGTTATLYIDGVFDNSGTVPTANTVKGRLFCVQNMRRGALLFQGAVDISYWHNQFEEILNETFLQNKTIGEAIMNAKNSDYDRNMYNFCSGLRGDLFYALIGDPTFEPKWR